MEDGPSSAIWIIPFVIRGTIFVGYNPKDIRFLREIGCLTPCDAWR